MWLSPKLEGAVGTYGQCQGCFLHSRPWELHGACEYHRAASEGRSEPGANQASCWSCAKLGVPRALSLLSHLTPQTEISRGGTAGASKVKKKLKKKKSSSCKSQQVRNELTP